MDDPAGTPSTVVITDRPETSGFRSSVVYPLLLLCIVTGFYWKLVFTYQYDWVWSPDLAQQVLPWLDEEVRQVHHGFLPLWDTHSWVGQPLLAQGQPGAAYPLNWILFLMPRQNGHIQIVVLQWYFVAIHYLAALFCYLLCRDLGRSKAASLLAGLVFALGGFVGTTEWPQMVNGAIWAPLVLLFLLRVRRGQRPLASSALSGLFLGVAWLSGHHQVPIYLTLAAGALWICYIFRGGKLDQTFLGLAAVSMAIAFLVSALQTIPTLEYGRLAERWAPTPIGWGQAVPYTEHWLHSFSPILVLAVLFPGLFSPSDPFIGIVAFSMALFAIAASWKDHAVKVSVALAISSIVYAFGRTSIFQGFLYAVVPMVEKARVPAMALAIFGLGAAVLASFGADRFASELSSRWARRLTLGVLAFGLVTYAVILATFAGKQFSWPGDDRIGVTALAAVLLAAVLHGWRTANLSRNQALTLVSLLLLLELGSDSGYWFAHRSYQNMHTHIEKVWSNGDIAAYLEKQPGRFRVETHTQQLVGSWGIYHDFDVIETPTAGVTANILKLDVYPWNTRMLLGVQFSIGEAAEKPDQKEVYRAESGLKLFVNPSAFPRVWPVHDIIAVKSAEEGNAVIHDHLDDLRWKVFLTDPPPDYSTHFRICPGVADKISIERYEPRRVYLRVEMGCDGMVVVSDTYYPGWVATVDDKRVPIYQVDNALRGVLVPQGSHRIAMRYRPQSVFWGAACSALGVLGALALMFRERRKAGK
jgi:hypothetical protein